MDGAPTTPPGWHPDPEGSGQHRWWDGANWTDHYQPPPPGMPQAAAPPPSAPPPGGSVPSSLPPAKSGAKGFIIGAAILLGLIVVYAVGNARLNEEDSPVSQRPATPAVEQEAASVANAPFKILPAQGDSEFAGNVKLDNIACGPSEVTGTVVNNSSQRLDIFITVYELDGSGTALDDRLASVNGLAAGEAGRWSSRVLLDSYDSCEIVITNVFES